MPRKILESHKKKVAALIRKGLIREEDLQSDLLDLDTLIELETALSILTRYPGLYLPVNLITSSSVRIFNTGFDAGRSGSAKIMVERHLGMGDVLLALIIAHGLWVKYGFKIYFTTSKTFFPLVKRNPFIAEVMTGEQAERFDFDLRICLQGEVDFLPFCEKNHRLDLMAAIAGLEREHLSTGFRLPVHKREKKLARELLGSGGWTDKDFLIGLNVESFAEIRTWPVERSIDLAKKLAARSGTKVVIIENQGSRNKFKSIENVIVPDDTSLEALVGLVSSCDLIICPDSGVLHLAGLLHRPTIALFGPILPDFRIRYYKRCTAIFHSELPCIPCWDLQTFNCVGKEYQACMTAITVEEVLFQIERTIEKIQ